MSNIDEIILSVDLKVRKLVRDLMEPTISRIILAEEYQKEHEKNFKILNERLNNTVGRLELLNSKIPNIDPISRKLNDSTLKLNSIHTELNQQISTIKNKIDSKLAEFDDFSSQLSAVYTKHESVQKSLKENFNVFAELRTFVESQVQDFKNQVKEPFTTQAETNLSFQIQLQSLEQKLETVLKDVNNVDYIAKKSEHESKLRIDCLERKVNSQIKQPLYFENELIRLRNLISSNDSKVKSEFLGIFSEVKKQVEETLNEFGRINENNLGDILDFVLIEPRYKKKLNELRKMSTFRENNSGIKETRRFTVMKLDPESFKESENLQNTSKNFRKFKKTENFQTTPKNIQDFSTNLEEINTQEYPKPENAEVLEIADSVENEESPLYNESENVENHHESVESSDAENIEITVEFAKTMEAQTTDNINIIETNKLTQKFEKIHSLSVPDLDKINYNPFEAPPVAESPSNLLTVDTPQPDAPEEKVVQSKFVFSPRESKRDNPIKDSVSEASNYCKYSDLGLAVEDLQKTFEVLSEKVDSLSSSMQNYVSNTSIKINAFKYSMGLMKQHFDNKLSDNSEQIEKNIKNWSVSKFEPYFNNFEQLISNIENQIADNEEKHESELNSFVQTNKSLETLLKNSAFEFNNYVNTRKRDNNDIKLDIKRIYSKIESLCKKHLITMNYLQNMQNLVSLMKQFLALQSDNLNEIESRFEEKSQNFFPRNNSIQKSQQKILLSTLNKELELISQTHPPGYDRSHTPELPIISRLR